MNRTSFTPRVENLETRALLTTIPGLTLEPTTDHAAQIGQSSHANNSKLEDIARSQKNNSAYVKIGDIMSTPDNSDLEQIAKSQTNNSAYVKIGDIMSTPETTRPAHQAAVDQLFALEGVKEGSLAGNDLWV